MKLNRDYKRPFLSFSRGIAVYLALLVFSVIFTQALRSPLSGMMLIFVLILPIVSFIHALIGLLSLDVFVGSMETRATKNSPVDYSLSITNASFIAFPFIEAIISLPKKDGVSCELTSSLISLNPFGSCRIDDAITFKYRGTYNVGVKYLYITDFLHIFRFRKTLDIYNTFLVMPEKMDLRGSDKAASSDLPTKEARRIIETEHSEFANIREYANGDSLKNIHWKMSSKMQDLFVNEFNTNISNKTYVLCDMATLREAPGAGAKPKTVLLRDGLRAFFAKLKQPKKRTMSLYRAEKLIVKAALMEAEAKKAKENGTDEPEYRLTDRERKAKARFEENLSLAKHTVARYKDPSSSAETENTHVDGMTVKDEFKDEIDQFCADGVVEIALARAIRDVKRGKECTLIWFDPRLERGAGIAELSSLNDIEEMYPLFSTAPAVGSDKNVTRLSTMIPESINVSLTVVSANIDTAAIASYAALPSSFGGAGAGCTMDVLLFNPEDKFKSLSEHRKYVSMCESRLVAAGIGVKDIVRFTDHDGTAYLDVRESTRL